MKNIKTFGLAILLMVLIGSMSGCIQITVNTTSDESSAPSISNTPEKQESTSSETGENAISELPHTVPNGYTIPDTNMTISVPEDAVMLSVDTPGGRCRVEQGRHFGREREDQGNAEKRDHGGDYCGKRRYHSRSGEIFRLRELRF